jgi:diacylglycerol O-acyltransferase / wax synthase
LAMETPGVPLHVGAVLTLDEEHPVTMPELRRLVAARLRQLPRFHQKVAFTPLALRRPEWVPARTNLDSHLFHHRVRVPGRPSQLFALCARIHEKPLARDRPLWEIHLIDGVDGRGQALMIKAHHAITDGVGGVGLAQVLFDRASASSSHVELPPTHFVHSSLISPLDAIRALVGLAFTAARGPIVGIGPFNGPVGRHRAFAGASLRMDAITKVKLQLGATIDDVLVALVAVGLRRYLNKLRYPDIPTSLRAMVPVSTRAISSRATFGNHVSAVFVDLPLDTAELPEVVARIAALKTAQRTAHAAEGASIAIHSVALLPNPVHELVLRIASKQRFGHLVLSDVPGLREPLFLLGRRIGACYPMMPLSSEVGLAIAAVSMDRVMGIGITADPGLVPEPRRLAKAIEWEFAHYARSSSTHAVPGAHRAA